jgi:hypothetical protein
MSKKIRTNSVCSNTSESSISIDSRSYSTDKSRSNSIELNFDTAIDLSNNIILDKTKWIIPIPIKKRRKRDEPLKHENVSTTPVINYEYLNFQQIINIESKSN